MKHIYQTERDGFVYRVFMDEDGYHNFFDSKYSADFNSPEEKEEYRKKFESEELEFYGVKKMKACPCCTNLTEKDSLWGIVADCPENAVGFYLEY